ncbi:MAG: HAMP domain-containing histidine kinase [Proteobacteria bacterium]|nr:HAMP domain-containing histidine kinase [Pseudomonadota bacterium]
MKTRQTLQRIALALVLIAVVQALWWLFDQHTYALQKARAARAAYTQQAAAAQALLDAGTPAARVQSLLPQISVSDGRARPSRELETQLLQEEQRRSNQYAWEGAFFLLALGAGLLVITRALRAEARVLEEQDSFLSLVSHQFKTPLASLQLSLETLALRAPPPPQARTLIDRMLADVARMELMVTQILESARLERGRVDFRPEPVALASAVAHVVTQLDERARRQQISINSDIAPQLQVLADPLALDVVVRNILENALAAVAAAGGGSGTVALTARTLPGQVELTVRDSGVGFSAADAAQLFERFTRLQVRGGHYGTGLGLFIVRRLMDLAHGRVSAASEGPGKGASFTLTWPAAGQEGA